MLSLPAFCLLFFFFFLGPNVRYKRRVDIFSIGMVLLTLVQGTSVQGKYGVIYDGEYVGQALRSGTVQVEDLFADVQWRLLGVGFSIWFPLPPFLFC